MNYFARAYRNFSSLFLENFLFFGSFVFLFGYLLFSVIIPFIRFNTLMSWDMAGLYFSAWYQKMYLFPKIIGWNPFFFLGYPQNQFYPPLYSYFTAALSYIVSLSVAFKIMFVLTIILLPLSFYFLARSFSFSRAKAAVSMVVLTSLLFIFKDYSGGTMNSTISIGLVTHALGMALFFFYWASLEKRWDTKYFILPSILFTLVILTHIVAAFAASFLFISYFICKVRNTKTLIFFLMHGFLVFLFSAFWTIPFIGKIAWLEAYPIGQIAYGGLFILTAFAYIFILSLKKENNYMPIGFFVLVVLIFSIISTSFFSIPIHLYRFGLFLYAVITFMILSLLLRRSHFIWVLILIIGILGVFISPIPSLLGPTLPNLHNLDSLGQEGGRVYVLAPYSQESSPHMLQHLVPLTSSAFSLRGLYIESARNARYIFDIENQLEPGDSVTWGTYIDTPFISSDNNIISNILPFQLDLLGVDRVIAPKSYSLDWEKKYGVAEHTWPGNNAFVNSNYSLYFVGNSSIIDVLNYTPYVFTTDWETYVPEWFLSEKIYSGVLVNREVPLYVGDGSETVNILEQSDRQDYLRFFVNASHPVPILVKISFFPNWKAYQNGVEIPIYQASPYIMLIYGAGEIELRYESLFVDSLGLAISIFGIIFCVYLIYRSNFKS